MEPTIHPNHEALIQKFIHMFGCDAARISQPSGRKLFLILGWNKNTAYERKKDPAHGRWYHNGQPVDFDYLQKQVVASGNTEEELIASAESYKETLSMTMAEYLEKFVIKGNEQPLAPYHNQSEDIKP